MSKVGTSKSKGILLISLLIFLLTQGLVAMALGSGSVIQDVPNSGPSSNDTAVDSLKPIAPVDNSEPQGSPGPANNINNPQIQNGNLPAKNQQNTSPATPPNQTVEIKKNGNPDGKPNVVDQPSSQTDKETSTPSDTYIRGY